MNRVMLLLVALAAVVGVGASAPSQPDEPTPVATDTLVIGYQPESDLASALMIDALEPATVLTIHATGFDSDVTGTIRQCVQGNARRCQNTLEVRFDHRGAATFQYLVTEDIGEGGGEGEPCRLGADRCTIELSVGDKVSVIDTFFGDEAPPPGRLRVAPRGDLLVGDTVTLSASRFPPGAELTVMICAAPSTSGPRCGAPGPEIPLTIGSDGTAEADLTLDVTEVGSDRVACGRRVGCRVVVASDQLAVRASPVPLSFAESPGADYATPRVVIGVTVSLVLALVAVWLVRSTDWDPPRESDSTLIDEAEFADLDLEAAMFDETERVGSA